MHIHAGDDGSAVAGEDLLCSASAVATATPVHALLRANVATDTLRARLNEDQYLCSHLNDVDGDGLTPVGLCCRHRKHELLEVLLAAGADPDLPMRVSPSCPLPQVEGCPFPPSPHNNLSTPHPPPPPLPEGVAQAVPPLLYACYLRDAELVELLLSYGADPYCEVVPGGAAYRSALGLLVFLGEFSLATRLIQRNPEFADLLINADPTVVNNVVRQPQLPGSEKFLEYLFTFETDPNVADDEGYTPLHHACEQGLLRQARVLLHAGADRAARTKAGHPPHFLALPHALPLLHALVSDDPLAARDLRDGQGRSLLHALLLAYVSKASLYSTASTPTPSLQQMDEQLMRQLAQRLLQLQVPVTTQRALLFGGGGLTLIQELSGVTTTLTPELRAVLEVLLRSSESESEQQARQLVAAEARVPLFEPDVQAWVEENMQRCKNV